MAFEATGAVPPLTNLTDGVYDVEHHAFTVGTGSARDRGVAFARAVFEDADRNGDGSLTKTEVRKYFKSHPIEKEHILGPAFTWKAFFMNMDKDGDGEFNLDEFTAVVLGVYHDCAGDAGGAAPVEATMDKAQVKVTSSELRFLCGDCVENTRNEAMVARCTRRSARAAAVHAFDSWVKTVVIEKRHRHTATVLLKRWQTRALGSVMKTWMELVDSRMLCRRVMRKIIRRYVQQALSKAFVLWLSARDILRDEEVEAARLDGIVRVAAATEIQSVYRRRAAQAHVAVQQAVQLSERVRQRQQAEAVAATAIQAVHRGSVGRAEVVVVHASKQARRMLEEQAATAIQTVRRGLSCRRVFEATTDRCAMCST